MSLEITQINRVLTGNVTAMKRSQETREKAETGQSEDAGAVQTAANTRDSYVASETAVDDKTDYRSGASVTKLSAEDRAALVGELKEQQAQQEQQFLSLIQDSILGQSKAFSAAGAVASMDSEGMWSFIASGNYTVDAETKMKAQEAISEDGFYGVKNTAQRLFDFAAAMAGDDVEKLKEYQSYVADGFSQAEKLWGGDLPEICYDTKKATEKLFEDYYAAKAEETQETEA